LRNKARLFKELVASTRPNERCRNFMISVGPSLSHFR